MTSLPRTPSKGKLPLFGAQSAIFPKGLGGGGQKPVDFAGFFAKSLMLERNPPTGLGGFSTGCAVASTVSPIFSTSAVFRFCALVSLYLSLFNKERKKKEGLKGKSVIHGFEHLLKKASTGFHPVTPLTRGYPWMRFFNCVNGLGVNNRPSTHPRVVLRVGTLAFWLGVSNG